MSFWNSEMGEITGNENDAFAKQFKHIPDNTLALAKIEKFENSTNSQTGAKYLNIDWIITEGDFKGSKVSQKIKVFDTDAKVKHRALNMLKLIYLLFNHKPRDGNPPEDRELDYFIAKVAGIRIRETEPNDEGKQYNWVSEVHKAQGFKCETGVQLIMTSKPRQSELDSAFRRNQEDLINDVPF